MKKPWLAGLLSFIFPGIGQLYIGKIVLGLLFLLLYIFTIVLSGGMFNDSLLLIGVVSFPIIWIISIIHAVVSARKLNTNGPNAIEG